MAGTKNRGGRPPKYDGQALSDPIGLRLPLDMVAELDKAAVAGGRTRIEEIRRRLAASFWPSSNYATAVTDELDSIARRIHVLTGGSGGYPRT